MRLKHFVIILSLIYALVICGGFLFYRLGVIYPQLVANTLEMHKKDIQSIGKAFSVEQEHLRTLVNDWAKWDDSYLFMQDLNSAYKESNLVPSTFTDASLHEQENPRAIQPNSLNQFLQLRHLSLHFE